MHATMTRSKAIALMLKVFHVAHDFTLPNTIKQELANEAWFQSMKDEYASLIKRKTQDLVSCPKNRKVNEKKWLFKIKKLVHRSLQKLKTRLVAKGYL